MEYGADQVTLATFDTGIPDNVFEDVTITKHNFKQVDALPFAKEGTLKEYLDVIYPENEK